LLLLSLALSGAPVRDTVPVTAPVGRDIQVGPQEILRTTTVGTGQALVFIPGIFGSAFGYRMLTGPLAERGYRTIVVEPLGYGWSSHPKDADYSFAAQTARVSSVLDSLGVTGALIVAQSSGAARSSATRATPLGSPTPSSAATPQARPPTWAARSTRSTGCRRPRSRRRSRTS
jgi:pimeloyl-ACP methyl ester carboxylesterase